MVEIIKSQKIRIYPNKHNQEVFEKYYDYQRSVWNRAIDERNRQYLKFTLNNGSFGLQLIYLVFTFGGEVTFKCKECTGFTF